MKKEERQEACGQLRNSRQLYLLIFYFLFFISYFLFISCSRGSTGTVTMPPKSYEGTWYTDEDMLDELRIFFFEDAAGETQIRFDLGIYRLFGVSGTAKIEDNQIKFKADDGNVFNGTMEFYGSGIKLYIEESPFYSEHPNTFDFTVRKAAAPQTRTAETVFEFNNNVITVDPETNASVAIAAYNGTETSAVIPSRIQGQTVVEIGYKAFSSKQLTSVVIPGTVIMIWEQAFADNNLASVTIPGSVVYINHEAFKNNPLTSITIGANVELGIVPGLGAFGFAFSEAFDNAYNENGKMAGTYTLINDIWYWEAGRFLHEALPVELFFPNDDFTGFDRKILHTDGTAENIVSLLVSEEILPKGTALLNFTFSGNSGHADMNAAYGNALRSTGTTGEAILLGALVNTLLTFYNLDEIWLTAEGEVIETGHVIIDFPIRFRNRY